MADSEKDETFPPRTRTKMSRTPALLPPRFVASDENATTPPFAEIATSLRAPPLSPEAALPAVPPPGVLINSVAPPVTLVTYTCWPAL